MSLQDDLEHKIEISAVLTVIGIILLFSTAVIVTLIAPRFVDASWTEPTSFYQVQMYEISDPNLYISSSMTEKYEPQYVYHLKRDFTLLAFAENESTRIVTTPDLERYVTRYDEPILKLTSRLLLLRRPEGTLVDTATQLGQQLRQAWERANPDWEKEGKSRLSYQIYELYDPQLDEAFVTAQTEGILDHYVDGEEYKLVDEPKQNFHRDPGVIYVNNPREYRVSSFNYAGKPGWRADPNGEPIASVEQLKGQPFGFLSRKELIELGERIYAIEGCWYCHSDQTRTLVQDVVLNGSDSFPAPPSSPNEYIYQKVTFPSTRRIGPDLSRVGVKRPSRDWHKGHFWSPKTASEGTIMPSFRHFFDNDPRGTSKSPVGIPNYKFEAIFQYMMTKGTRVTPPTQAWWLGKDPIDTKAIIDGRTQQ
jgi:cytochrome c oxidase cbb3-type subunit 2